MPVYTIQTPDGRKLKIEAANEAAAIRGAQEWSREQQKLRGASYQAQMQRGQKAVAKGGLAQAGAELSGAMSNAFSGVPFFQDLAAGVGVIMDPRVYTGKLNPLQSYEANRQAIRADTEGFAQRRPYAAAAAQSVGIGGSALVPVGPAANAFTRAPQGANALARAGNAVANTGRAAVTGGATSAAYALGSDGTVQQRLNNAETAAKVGAVVGAATPAVVSAVTRRRAAKAATKAPAPTLDQLRDKTRAAYQAVDDAGVKYNAEAVDDLVRNITVEMQAANLSATRHPKAASMLVDIGDLRGKPATLTELDQLRQVIRRDVASSSDPAERFFGKKMIANIDEFLDAANAPQMARGDGQAAASLIRSARELNTRTRKVEAVTEATEKATMRAGGSGSGGNLDNATRQELRKVLERQRNLSEEERKLLRSIVLGSPGQNTLRAVGKLSPQNPLLGVTGAIGGTMIGGPVGGAAVPAVGMVAKASADAITQRKVLQLVDLMARGGKPAVAAEQQLARIAANDPAVQQIYSRVVARLIKTEGAAVGSATANATASQ